MSTEKAGPEIVLHTWRTLEYGAERIYAAPMVIEPTRDYPTNISWSGWLDPCRDLADLRLECWISTYDGRPVIDNLEYKHVTAIGANRAESMARVLRKARSLQQRDQSVEPGDMFMLLAKVCGAKRCAVRPTNDRSQWHNEGAWFFEPAASGRDRFRRLVAEAVAEVAPTIKQREQV